MDNHAIDLSLPPHPGELATIPGRIGLCWAGSATHPNDQTRSMPFAACVPLFDFCVENGLEMQSLQFGYEVSPPLIPCPIGDFYDTACAIARCELVITVDTSVCHVAGTLGKPTWLLLPFSAEWRWLQHRSDTPWYPSMTLFRQSQPDNWDDLVSRVVARLRLGVEDAA